MRPPGIGEIILIIIVAVIVMLGVKVFGTPPAKKRRVVEDEDEDDEEEDEKEAGDKRVLKARHSRRAQILGIVVILVGAIVMLSTLTMVKWFFWGPLGAIALIVVGIITIFVSRRR
ncbi:MAG: hypothetical protein ABH934_04315 [Chloroflexota bacterium]